MLKILVYILLLVAGISIAAAPWMTGVLYSLNAILQPKYVWPWTFPDLAVSKITAICCILAWGISVARKTIDLSVYKKKQNLLLVMLWSLMHLSDMLSPYQYYFAGVKAEVVLSALNTIIILYFVQLGLFCQKENWGKPLIYLVGMFVFVICYYVYWSNDHYFANNWGMFTQGRLNGPRGSPYGDQNALATLVVMGMPFIIFAYFFVKKFWVKVGCLFITPLLWHSLFLFGSRGSLLAVLVTTLMVASMLEKHFHESKEVKFKNVKAFKILLTIGLVAAIATQGGALLNRSTSTVNQAQAGGEEPINPRIVSWTAAIEIIKEYPILGVGPQRFQMAAKSMGGMTPHVAHNTFFNFSANCGLPVGIIFLLLCWGNFKGYFFCKRNHIEKYPLLDYLNKACTCSLVGFAICSIFLDLIVFEPFYLLIMLNLLKMHIFQREAGLLEPASEKQPRSSQHY